MTENFVTQDEMNNRLDIAIQTDRRITALEEFNKNFRWSAAVVIVIFVGFGAMLFNDTRAIRSDIAEMKSDIVTLTSDVSALQSGQEHILIALREEGIIK